LKKKKRGSRPEREVGNSEGKKKRVSQKSHCQLLFKGKKRDGVPTSGVSSIKFLRDLECEEKREEEMAWEKRACKKEVPKGQKKERK